MLSKFIRDFRSLSHAAYTVASMRRLNCHVVLNKNINAVTNIYKTNFQNILIKGVIEWTLKILSMVI